MAYKYELFPPPIEHPKFYDIHKTALVVLGDPIPLPKSLPQFVGVAISRPTSSQPLALLPSKASSNPWIPIFGQGYTLVSSGKFERVSKNAMEVFCKRSYFIMMIDNLEGNFYTNVYVEIYEFHSKIFEEDVPNKLFFYSFVTIHKHKQFFLSTNI